MGARLSKEDLEEFNGKLDPVNSVYLGIYTVGCFATLAFLLYYYY